MESTPLTTELSRVMYNASARPTSDCAACFTSEVFVIGALTSSMPCLSSAAFALSAITTAFGSPSLMISPSFFTFGNCVAIKSIKRVMASGFVSEAPDTLPPGCSRFVTTLASSGSVTAAKRIGVSFLIA
ncbi:hypothetical protein D3C71_1433970 [compost metagenome]